MKRRGFTLLEVLVTMVLMAILLPVIMSGVSLASRAGTIARKKAEATQLAQSKLTELTTTSQILPGSLSGDFSPDFPDYSWQATLTSRDLGLMEIDLKVTWNFRGTDENVELDTFVYQTGQTSSSGTSQ